MIHVVRNVRFFILAALCVNPLISSEHKSFPVPKHSNGSAKSFAELSSFLSLGNLQGMISHIRMPNLGRIFENIDTSYAIKIVQDNKVVLSVAGSAVLLSLLIKYLQRSERLREKYIEVSTSVDTYTNEYIEECPVSVQCVLSPIKIFIQFLCNTVKKYIGMNKTIIISSVAAPVAGRLLDCVLVCPIPLLNFTSIGCMASGGILTKGYFDSHFEKVDERFDKVDQKLGGIETKIDSNHLKIVSEIQDVKKEVGIVRRLLQSLEQKSDTVASWVEDCGKQLRGIASKIINLEKIGQKNSQQLESIESQVLLLREELGLIKKEAQDLCVVNKALQENLDAMRDRSDERFDRLEEKVEGGFARVEHKLDRQHTTVMFPLIDMPQSRSMLQQETSSTSDIQKQLLMIQLGQS